MLGRRGSEDGRRHISSSSSSSSPPISPTEPLPRPTRPAGQRSARSESFKALLLRKGSRSESSSRISAVERLRVAAASTTCDLRGVMSLPLPPPPPPDKANLKPTSSSFTSDTCEINTHLTLDVPVSPTSPCSQNFSLMLTWSPNQLLVNSSSSSPFYFLSSSSLRPRSRTPPCSSSRRFAARCRLYAAPMTAIFEEESEEEEEEDDEVFMESPGSEGESSQRLVELS